MNQGRQVVPVDYFINNDLEYLRGESSNKKYTTSTTKTKAVKYDIPGIEDIVPSVIAVTKVKVMEWYDYGYLEEIDVRREDQQLYKFKEGDFSRLHMHDIKDMLVEDLQLGVKSYQKKLNITKLETFRLMCTDELYKFSDRKLTSIRTVLHDIASNLRMDYLPKRR
ncbi:hypothetical protein Tco_1154350 [Tanacetum coccineum]